MSDEVKSLQTQLKSIQAELARVTKTAKENEALSAKTVKDLTDKHETALSAQTAEMAATVKKMERTIENLRENLKEKRQEKELSEGVLNPPNPAQTDDTSFHNQFRILQQQLLSLADPSKKEEVLQSSALAAMTLQDSDDITRATAKVLKNKKFDLPLSDSVSLTEVQENPYIYLAIMHPKQELDLELAASKANTIILGLAARYNFHSSNLIEEVTRLITGIPTTMKALTTAKTSAKGMFDCLLPTLETIAAKLDIMQKRDHDRKNPQRGGRRGGGGGPGGRGGGGWRRRGNGRGGGGHRYNNNNQSNQHNYGYNNYNNYNQQSQQDQEHYEQEENPPKRAKKGQGVRGRGGRGY